MMKKKRLCGCVYASEKEERAHTGSRYGAVLVAGGLEDEVRERLGATGGLGRSVTREVVEGRGEDGAYVELSREVDNVDG